MKKFVLFLLVSVPLAVLAQDPFLLDIFSKKLSEGRYTITAKVKLAPNWHLYAQADEENGLEAVQFYIDHPESSGPLGSSRGPELFDDPLFGHKKIQVYTGEFILSQDIQLKGEAPSVLRVTVKGFLSNDKAFLPLEAVKEVRLEGGVDNGNASRLLLPGVDLGKPVSSCGGEGTKESRGLLFLFGLGLLGGFIALLTPCVFPMIPVTVSYFTAKSGSRTQGIRNGSLYGLFIFLIYLLLSLPFHLADNISPQIFNTIATNAIVNIVFFVIFIFFALSFFGLFELSLPSQLLTKTDGNSSISSIGGIFFMALTLAVVSFSCTGPILGSLLVGSLSAKGGGAWQLTAGMAGFGAALALPFMLFALFPGWIKNMPKSGGWMKELKTVLAFIELGLAFKFLSNADLVEHWGILKREVFIGIWLLIAAALGLYLLGVRKQEPAISFRVVNGTNKKKFPIRKSGGVLALLFALYLVPGLSSGRWANLQLLSGFAPPLHYSVYGKNNAKGKGLEPDVVNDFEKALELSRKENKPILVDFTGWACVNCRKMEEQVWTKPDISDLIKKEYILVSLYVDDRQKLPAGRTFWYKTKKGDQKEVATVGDHWALFQSENFGQVTQPLYVLLSPTGVLLNRPVGYTPNVGDYKQWLECGLEANGETEVAATKTSSL